MERNNLLKSIGFSERFLQALNEHEKAVPTVYYESPFNSNELDLENYDSSGQLIISQSTNNYNQVLVVQQY